MRACVFFVFNSYSFKNKKNAYKIILCTNTHTGEANENDVFN